MIYLVLELYWSLVSKGDSISEVQQEVKSRLEKRRVRGRGYKHQWLATWAGRESGAVQHHLGSHMVASVLC